MIGRENPKTRTKVIFLESRPDRPERGLKRGTSVPCCPGKLGRMVKIPTPDDSTSLNEAPHTEQATVIDSLEPAE